VGRSRLVRDWIDETISAEDREFLFVELESTAELVRLLERVDKKHEGEVLRMTLLFKYAFYDTAADFIPQFIRNMGILAAQITRLI